MMRMPVECAVGCSSVVDTLSVHYMARTKHFHLRESPRLRIGLCRITQFLECYLTACLEQTRMMDNDKGLLFRTIGAQQKQSSPPYASRLGA